MIYKLKLSNRHIQCNLWVNEYYGLPIGNVGEIINNTVPISNWKLTQRIQLALELSLPKNASNYALVGFEYKPNDNMQNYINISVNMSDELVEHSKGNLAMPNDKVFIGISKEYGHSVLNTAVDTIKELSEFMPGEITFNVGAHAECGSSNFIFSQATRVALELSQLDLLLIPESEIQKKIESML